MSVESKIDTSVVSTIPMSASHVPEKFWDTRPGRWGGRHPGSFQIVWDGANATDATVSWEISNDGINWTTWMGSWSSDNSAVSSFTINAPSGVQIFEVREWVAAYYRINYNAGSNTTGSLTYSIFRNT